jgi:hypothetical protein
MARRLGRQIPVFLAFCLTCCLNVYAQGMPQGKQEPVPCNCRELRFTLQPGAGHNFVLPLAQTPIRIEVSVTANNGGTQEPSELMYALVNQDPSSKQLTWIGTNSDGSTSGSSSLKSKIIARIFGGGPNTVNATLNVQAAATRALAINQNASTTSVPCEYVVKIYY